MRPPLPWGLILTLPLRGSVAANGKIKSPTNFPILRWPQLGSFWLVSYHNMRGIPQLGPASTGPPSTGGSSKSFQQYIYIYIYIFFFSFLLCGVFIAVCRLSLVATCGHCSSLWQAGFSLRWLLLWQNMDSRHTDLVVTERELSCSAAYGIFLDHGCNPCPLHWQADS